MKTEGSWKKGQSGNPNGRPKIIINKDEFEKLCSIQCTKDEMCGWFDVDEKTLTRFCEDEYGMSWEDVFKLKSAKGKMSLRRQQFRLAEDNVTMSIWLGKQYLGQKDRVEQEIGYTPEVTIQVVDNSELESALYETENKS